MIAIDQFRTENLSGIDECVWPFAHYAHLGIGCMSDFLLKSFRAHDAGGVFGLATAPYMLMWEYACDHRWMAAVIRVSILYLAVTFAALLRLQA